MELNRSNFANSLYETEIKRNIQLAADFEKYAEENSGYEAHIRELSNNQTLLQREKEAADQARIKDQNDLTTLQGDFEVYRRQSEQDFSDAKIKVDETFKKAVHIENALTEMKSENMSLHEIYQTEIHRKNAELEASRGANQGLAERIQKLEDQLTKFTGEIGSLDERILADKAKYHSEIQGKDLAISAADKKIRGVEVELSEWKATGADKERELNREIDMLEQEKAESIERVAYNE